MEVPPWVRHSSPHWPPRAVSLGLTCSPLPRRSRRAICDPALPPPPLTSQLPAEWGGRTLRAQALRIPHYPLRTLHPPTALPPNPSPTALPQALRPTTKTAPSAPRANPCRGWHVLCTTIDSPLGLGVGVGLGVGLGPRAPRANLCRGWHVLCATRRTMLTLPTGAGAWHVLRPQRGERAEGF